MAAAGTEGRIASRSPPQVKMMRRGERNQPGSVLRRFRLAARKCVAVTNLRNDRAQRGETERSRNCNNG
jgi:hypothetical protein